MALNLKRKRTLKLLSTILVLVVALSYLGFMVLRAWGTQANYTLTAPNADTYLRSNAATTNYGNIATMLLQGTAAAGGARRPILNFSALAVPAGAKVETATVSLWVSALTTGGLADVHRVTRTWVEGTGGAGTGATWNTYNGAANWTAAGGDFAATATASTNITATGARYGWNVASDVQQWVNGTSVNNGWIFRGQNEAASTLNVTVGSRTAVVAQRPQLVLAYIIGDSTFTTPSSARAGVPTTFTMRLSNTGGANGDQMNEATFTIPAGYTAISAASAAASNGKTWTVTTQPGATGPTTVKVTSSSGANDLTNGQYVDVTLTATPTAIGTTTWNAGIKGAAGGWYNDPTPATIVVNRLISVSGTADTYVRSSAATTNYGNATTMLLYGTGAGSTRRPLLNFALPAVPAGATVESATLSLYVTALTTGGLADVQRVTRSWTEGTGAAGSGATWNTYNGVNPWTTLGGDFSTTVTASTNITAAAARYAWNVAGDVQQWINGTATNYGWIIRGQNEAASTLNVTVASKENATAANRPQLNFAYIIGDSTITPSLTRGPAPTTFTMRLTNTGGVNGDWMNEATVTIPAGYTAISSASASATGFGKTWTVTTPPGATGPTTARVSAAGATDNLADGEYVDLTFTATTPGSSGNTTFPAGIKGTAGGWYADPTPAVVSIDASPPTTTLSTSPLAPDGNNGWFKTAPAITLTSDQPGFTQYQWDSTASAWTTYAGAGLLGQQPGTHTLYYRSVDGVNNTETPANNQVFKIDTGLPTDPTSLSSSSHTTGTPSNNPNVVANFSGATDTVSGVEGYSISWSQGATATPPATLNTSASVSTTTSPSLTPDGDWWFNQRTKDYAGNWTSTVHMGPFVIDTATPTVSPVTPTSGETSVSIGANTVVGFSEDMDAATINGANFTLKDASNTPVAAAVSYNAGAKRATLDPTGSLSFSTTYTASLTSGVKDSAGNALAPYSFSFSTMAQPDTSAPITSLVTDLGGPDGDNGWYKTTPVITLSRNEAGTTFYQWDSTSAAWTTYGSSFSALGGVHSLYYYSVDTVGNTETVSNALFKVDTGSPTDPTSVGSSSHTTGTPSPVQNVAVNFSGATDTVSGVEGYSISWSQGAAATPTATLNTSASVSATTSLSLTPDGSWWFNLRTKDTAGNWTSTVHMGPFVIDTGAPSTTLSTTPLTPNGDNGWFSSDPTITLSRSEPGATYYKWGSAGATQTYSGGFAGIQGQNTLYYWSADSAGNTETPVNTQVFKIDSGIPTDPTTLSSSSHTAGTPSNNPNVVVNFSGATDTASGVEGYSVSWSQGATATPPATVNTSASVSTTTSPSLTPDGSWWFNQRTKDYAGNWTSTVHLGPFVIDTEAPTVDSVSPPDGQTDVSIADNVTATFSEDMDTATIDGASFTLKDASNTPVSATVTYNAGPRTATLYPDGNLENGQTYTATLTSGVKDIAGNALAPFTFDFTTVAIVDSSPPVTSASTTPSAPDGGAGWFKTNPTISLSRTEAGDSYYQWDSTSSAWTTYGSPFSALEGDHTLYYYSVDTAGNTETPANSQDYKVDTGLPTDPISLSSSSHTTGTPSPVQNVVVNFSGAADAASGVEGYSTSWSQGAAATPPATLNTSASVSTTTSPSLTPDGSWWFNLRTKDYAGNWTSTEHLGPFIIDTADPTVTAVSPTDGQLYVAVDSNVVATFSEEMDAATIDGATFTLKDASDTTIAATVSYNAGSKTATLDPDAGLGYSKTYTAALTSGAKDLAGNSLSPYTFSFTTRVEPVTGSALPHGGYSTTSDACNTCHAVHLADGPSSLRWSAVDKAATGCEYCHGETGVVATKRVWLDQNGHGLKPDQTGDIVAPDDTTYTAYTNDNWGCVSCHSPHGSNIVTLSDEPTIATSMILYKFPNPAKPVGNAYYNGTPGTLTLTAWCSNCHEANIGSSTEGKSTPGGTRYGHDSSSTGYSLAGGWVLVAPSDAINAGPSCQQCHTADRAPAGMTQGFPHAGGDSWTMLKSSSTTGSPGPIEAGKLDKFCVGSPCHKVTDLP